MKLIIITLIVLLYLICLVLFAIGVEQVFHLILGKAPSLASQNKLREAALQQIARDSSDAKTIIDIGSGWGGLAREIARRFPNARVYGAELFPMPYLYSKLRGIFFKNTKFVLGNAFKFMKNQNFDIGITYLLPEQMAQVQEYHKHFKMLIVIDFPLPDAQPVRKIKLHRDILGQHWIFVYDLRDAKREIRNA
ncbi:MAG: class I SAM-dependent methyltransferase [Alphaproteobacteria bacterium]|nr:class I SAM-dependent methyltransferase [Alphaproteobacteria bacterium]